MNTTNTPNTVAGPNRLRRMANGRILGGVAGGVAEYLGIDIALARIGFVALCFFGGVGVPLYVAGWLLIPEEGTDEAIADDLLGHARTS